jgi:hypothetical protein
MAGVLSVASDPRSPDDAWRIFLDNHLAGGRLHGLGCERGQQAIDRARSCYRVTVFGRSPVAKSVARHNAGKPGVRALGLDAPGAA